MLKLSTNEKKELRNRGYSLDDIKEINFALKKTTYTLILEPLDYKDITPEEAIKILGKDEWLRGISRAAFHIETVRTAPDGQKVRIYAKTWEN